MHTDLSIPALHMQLFPFLQPIIDAVKNAPCNLTLIAPASPNVLRIFKMAYERYCGGDSEWADTDACTNTRKIIEIDQVAVDNARKLADMNMQGQPRARTHKLEDSLRDRRRGRAAADTQLQGGGDDRIGARC